MRGIMTVQELPVGKIVVDIHGMQSEIDQLEKQMQGLEPGSPEYEYDQLQLKREQLELQVREENPDIDPLSLEGSDKLDEILKNDPRYQSIVDTLETMRENGEISA